MKYLRLSRNWEISVRTNFNVALSSRCRGKVKFVATSRRIRQRQNLRPFGVTSSPLPIREHGPGDSMPSNSRGNQKLGIGCWICIHQSWLGDREFYRQLSSELDHSSPWRRFYTVSLSRPCTGVFRSDDGLAKCHTSLLFFCAYAPNPDKLIAWQPALCFNPQTFPVLPNHVVFSCLEDASGPSPDPAFSRRSDR